MADPGSISKLPSFLNIHITGIITSLPLNTSRSSFPFLNWPASHPLVSSTQASSLALEAPKKHPDRASGRPREQSLWVAATTDASGLCQAGRALVSRPPCGCYGYVPIGVSGSRHMKSVVL